MRYKNSKVFYFDGKLLRVSLDGKLIEVGNKVGGHGKSYLKFILDNQRHYNHLYIWKMFNGAIPIGLVIDHINNDSFDNRIENLRCVSRSENLRNKNNKSYKNNTSGIKGVHHHKNRGKYTGWTAQITYKGKNIYLGHFKEKTDAMKARKLAEIKYKI